MPAHANSVWPDLRRLGAPLCRGKDLLAQRLQLVTLGRGWNSAAPERLSAVIR